MIKLSGLAKKMVGVALLFCAISVRPVKLEELLPPADEAHGLKVTNKNHPPSFTSKSGGYSMNLPKKWHSVEIVEDNRYVGVFSPEEIKDISTDYGYGIKIVRYKNYKKEFSLEGEDMNIVTLEYFKRVAKEIDPDCKEPAATMVMGTENGPNNTFIFQVFRNGAKCKTMMLTVMIRKDALFHALCSMPCNKEKKLSAECNTILWSVDVEESWKEQ
jgi:hypothetical protein